ncbi:phosphatidylglycerophosphatase [Pokkaliibacter plantistimulans]|uniref:Phosphatidylglycerophosphatase A n=1 Tax=Pokkaliibacter plantistimulans TaxID=1635171 RepID=A0ABX5M5I9_9GAMM|nr:phosphatidylglycerophosphatase A [Pokkaliibacter plantistimulans]PXF32993.1 phosphatidylglycerophosphatase [Pokkaliibacter plantistimulans]
MAKHYPPLPISIWRHPAHILAFGFGSGLSPKAPGTVGTLAAVPFVWLAMQYSLMPYLIILLVASLVGIYVCDKTARDLRVHDHPGIVWDEFVGYGITLIAAPDTSYALLLAFFWFRLFDIAKPWPIRVLDAKVHGGWGIMLDDIVAGMFAWVAVQLSYLLWQLF